MLTLLPLNLRFACDTCRKGHRTSRCTHTRRVLHEVRQKGRPASQCGHCRAKRRAEPVEPCSATSSSSLSLSSSATRNSQHNHHRCLCGSGSFVRRTLRADFSCGTVLIFDPERDDVIPIQNALHNDTSKLALSIANRHTAKSRESASETTDNVSSKTIHPLELADVSVLEQACDKSIIKMLANPCNCALTGMCVCSSLSNARVDDTFVSPTSQLQNQLPIPTLGKVEKPLNALDKPSTGGCCKGNV